MNKREQLEQAIALQEGLRRSVDDTVIDAAINALKKRLAELEEVEHQRKLVSILLWISAVTQISCEILIPRITWPLSIQH